MASEVCAICSKPASKKCGACHLVFYCSRDHQKQDWKKHKISCCSFKLADDPDLGRHLIASRDIAAGELLMKEFPLVAGPQQFTVPVCLGCYSVADGSRECSACGWPICSEACEKAIAHRAECTLTLRRGSKVSIKTFFQRHPIFQCVTVLRCLYLKETNTSGWEKLNKLVSHCEKRIGTEKYEADRTAVAKFIRSFFVLEEVSEETILKLCGIIQVNGHEVPLSDPPYVAVFEKVSMLENNCTPNCSKTFSNDGEVLIRSAVPIMKGEHLSICYADPIWGTRNRRHFLLETKYFSCACTRCRDPTELGTFLSSLKCPKCPATSSAGYLLPKNPLEYKTSWQCNICEGTTDTEKIEVILEEAGKHLVSLMKGNIKACEDFIRKYSMKILHPNHYYLTEVKLAVAQLYGRTTNGSLVDISDEVLAAKFKICSDVLQIADSLVPGII